MRNLKLQYCKQIASTVADAEYLLLDPAGRDSDLLYLTTADKLYSYRTGAGLEIITEVPGIVAAEFLSLNTEICLATSIGEVLIVNPQTREVTEGTFCDAGIESMVWSPDQEVVVFVTKEQHVVVMTCTYDPIAEHMLTEQCSSDEQFVNVGWGKKETQFHGSEGKKAAKQTTAYTPPKDVSGLPQNIEVTWRADGAYFAVSFLSETIGRMFKVFDKEGSLQFTSEKVNNLYPIISWRPSGTWLAVPQRLPNKSTVALFEKNGLRHREIVLPFGLDDEPIVALRWSPDSDILAVETRDAMNAKHTLYLYTIGNYHWYLKQVLHFSANDPIVICQWDNKIGDEKVMHVILKSGKYFIYRWHFVVDRCDRLGTVAVIDGRKLLISDQSKSVVPPPMCNRELECDAYINACSFLRYGRNVLLLVYDEHHKLHMFTSLGRDPSIFEGNFILEPDATLKMNLSPLELGNLCWLQPYLLVSATCQSKKSKLMLIVLDMQAKSYKLQSSLELNNTVSALCNGNVLPLNIYEQTLNTAQNAPVVSGPRDVNKNFFVQTLDGYIHEIHVPEHKSLKFHKLCTQLRLAADQIESIRIGEKEEHLVALCTNQCLYLNAEIIAEDVTSFCRAGNYLAYTQLSQLYFMHLRDKRVVNKRGIERGGRLISIPLNTHAVLQMPRGNLETIYPRALMLEKIGALLEECKFREAMVMLRKHRINLNILCDHNLCSFVKNINAFLTNIDNTNWLNLFISDLENEDFTKTMYGSYYGDERFAVYPEGFKIKEKVAYICEKLLNCMENNRNLATYRLPIITCHVKLGRIERALLHFWQEYTEKNIEECSGGRKGIEDALTYLLYMVDVNQLYTVALGTYDLGLALHIAQKSQMDPKEYVPQLNEFKSYDIHYRWYKIDVHLKRYQRALTNIAVFGHEKFEEALELTKRHALYKDAMEPYLVHRDCYNLICLEYADYLREQGQLASASIMYERGGNLAQALYSAKHVLDWERVLALAHKDKQPVAEIALSMVGSLEEAGKYTEAFQLLKSYGGTFKIALDCLLRGKLFLRAICEVMTQQSIEDSTTAMLDEQLANEKIDIMSTEVVPALLAYNQALELKISADEELFINYKQRLLTLRDNKTKQQYANDHMDLEIDELDLLSDTTSVRSSRYTGSSTGTGKTFRSSKNRRKHERKLFSLKPGNPFEDIALIDALHNEVLKVFKEQQHIHDTCKALLLVENDAAAKCLQKRFKELLTIMQESLDEIWIAELSTSTAQHVSGPNVDYTALRNEQRYAMINPQKRIKPELNLIDWEHDILK